MSKLSKIVERYLCQSSSILSGHVFSLHYIMFDLSIVLTRIIDIPHTMIKQCWSNYGSDTIYIGSQALFYSLNADI